MILSSSRRRQKSKSPSICRGLGELVDLDEETSNQIFAELDNWEQILKDTSLSQPKPPGL